MGLKLGKVFRSVVKRIPGVATAFATGGASLMLPGGAMSILKPGGFTNGGIGGGVPSIQAVTGVPALFAQPVIQRNGGIAVPTAAGAIAPLAMGLSRAVLGAIVRLGGALGIAVTAANVSRVGLRLWRSVTALARRHPGISILAFLTGLGLAADEAAEFLFWGQAKARRRRGRGISARDIRTCRRTMRKMASFAADLGAVRGVRRHVHVFPPRRRRIHHHHHNPTEG